MSTTLKSFAATTLVLAAFASACAKDPNEGASEQSYGGNTRKTCSGSGRNDAFYLSSRSQSFTYAPKGSVSDLKSEIRRVVPTFELFGTHVRDTGRGSAPIRVRTDTVRERSSGDDVMHLTAEGLSGGLSNSAARFNLDFSLGSAGTGNSKVYYISQVTIRELWSNNGAQVNNQVVMYCESVSATSARSTGGSLDVQGEFGRRCPDAQTDVRFDLNLANYRSVSRGTVRAQLQRKFGSSWLNMTGTTSGTGLVELGFEAGRLNQEMPSFPVKLPANYRLSYEVIGSSGSDLYRGFSGEVSVQERSGRNCDLTQPSRLFVSVPGMGVSNPSSSINSTEEQARLPGSYGEWCTSQYAFSQPYQDERFASSVLSYADRTNCASSIQSVVEGAYGRASGDRKFACVRYHCENRR